MIKLVIFYVVFISALLLGSVATAYLFSAFIAFDLNVAHWTYDVRVGMTMLTTLFSVTSTALAAVIVTS